MQRQTTVRAGRRAAAGRLLLRYRDLAGRWRAAPERTRTSVRRILGEPRASPIDPRPTGKGRPLAPGSAGTGIPPVIVVRTGPGRRRVFRLPGPFVGGECRLFGRAEGSDRWRPFARAGRGRFVVPAAFSFGCHELRVGKGSRGARSRLVVAPPRLVRRGPSRRWGVFAPVYALRDDDTLGCGDLTTLERLGAWAASQGASVLATLPILPAFLDRPYEPSPYRPVSRRFWNELYLDPRRTAEFARSRAAQGLVRSRSFRRRVAVLERRAYVDFRAVARLKRAVLERMLTSFARAPRARRAAYRRFVRGTPGIREYARFRAALERGGSRAVRYHLFVQWLVDEQLRAVAARLAALGVDLCLDLPLGTDPQGFEAHQDSALLVREMRTGAPPDPGIPRGQDWGFSPWHPGRLRDAGYRPWADALAHHFSVARWLRIDHVLGLHRVFWIPAGGTPSDGAYVRFPAEELYGVLLAEAARAGAEVIGEDLGTVAPELRPSLRRHGLLRLFVAQLEWDGAGPLPSPPPDCVASLNTHDHPPFARFWEERSVRPAPPSARAGSVRRRDTAADAFQRVTLSLARSRARLLLLNLEDLWGERRPQNVPGRSGPRMFSRRFRVGLPALGRDPRWSAFLRSVDAVRRSGSGRG